MTKFSLHPYFSLQPSAFSIAMNKYDVIVIGGGHNGLVNAAYLARAGRSVLVLERRELVGGAAVTEEVFPGPEGPLPWKPGGEALEIDYEAGGAFATLDGKGIVSAGLYWGVPDEVEV